MSFGRRGRGKRVNERKTRDCEHVQGAGSMSELFVWYHLLLKLTDF
jgi:hypothetical protein